MFNRFVGIALISSLLFAGCATTTTTQTCWGPICGSETTTTTHWPESSGSEPADDHTGAIIAAGALLTAVALTAVLVGRSKNNDESEKPKSAAMTDAELRMHRMFAQAHLSARAGRCDAVTAIGKKLALEQPAEYQRFASNRELARCLVMTQGPSVSLR